jgi:acetyl-CoA carboxylase carboxyl transferase subunit beta
MHLAARIGLPVVSLVDTPGAYPGREAEEGGQSGAIAHNILALFELPTPVITVVVGEGGSGGALALAVADRVLIAERGTYSVISPEGCSAILWGDAASAAVAARALRITAHELLAMGVVDGVIPEPAGGAQADPAAMTELLRAALVTELDALSGTGATVLLRRRRERFRRFGDGGFRAATGRDGALRTTVRVAV